MGGGLAGDVQPLGPGFADQRHALLGGDVAYVVAAAGFPDQLDIPGDLPPFALGADAPEAVGAGPGPVVDAAAMQQAVVLAVGGDQPAQRFCLPHRRAHHGVRLHAVAVVGKGDHISGHAVHVGQGFPGLVHGDGPVGEYADDGVPSEDIQLGLQVFDAVGHRVQVRHGADGGVAAPGRRQCAGANGLLIGKARLTQMNMHICEAGHRIQEGL